MTESSVSDPHSFNMDPDTIKNLNANPDSVSGSWIRALTK
jgi:hypothetical protein